MATNGGQGAGAAGDVERRLQQLSTGAAQSKLAKEAGKTYGEDVENLESDKGRLEAEVQRLSTQVLQLTGDCDAYMKHCKQLGQTLKQVRRAAEAHNIQDADLGVNLHRSFSIQRHTQKIVKEEGKEGEDPRLAALKLAAIQNGWFIDPGEVKIGKKIGEGATADIYLGLWHGLDVAVKCLRSRYMKIDENSIESFVQEVELLARQRHPYVLRLYGASLDYPDKCWVVTELLPNGTLTEWLHGEKTRNWTRHKPLPPLKERVRMALEVAQAMQYLHEQKPTVIHRDLKPSNVFIDASLHARVADFGFARTLLAEDNALTGETGTYMYMAPEVIKHEHYGEKCDVYSFSILLCELLTGVPPYMDTYLTPVQMAVGVSEGTLRPKLPTSGPEAGLNSLATACWAQDPAKRPTFADIAILLRSHLKELSREPPPKQEHRGGVFGFMHG